MSKKTSITVLTPVYNAEKYLREAIDSILNQTFKDFEFLIINDASTDSSKDIILSYKDPRIKYFENSKNLGVARTLNKGLKLARGDYIARMDGDDISLPDRLKLQLDEFKKDKKIVIVTSFNEVIDENSNYLEKWIKVKTPEEIFYTLHFNNCIAHSTVMYKKNVILKEFKGYNELHDAEDFDMWVRISKKYKFIKIKKVLLKLRIHSQNRTSYARDEVNHDALMIAANSLQRSINKPIDIRLMRILFDYSWKRSNPSEIKRALLFLQKANKFIIKFCPGFLRKEEIGKIAFKKERLLIINLLLSILSHSQLAIIFNFLYFVYSFIKKFTSKFFKYLENLLRK